MKPGLSTVWNRKVQPPIRAAAWACSGLVDTRAHSTAARRRLFSRSGSRPRERSKLSSMHHQFLIDTVLMSLESFFRKFFVSFVFSLKALLFFFRPRCRFGDFARASCGTGRRRGRPGGLITQHRPATDHQPTWPGSARAVPRHDIAAREAMPAARDMPKP